MVNIHCVNERGRPIKVFVDEAHIPVVGDRLTMVTGRGDYNYLVRRRKFVYSWKSSGLKYVVVTLEQVGQDFKIDVRLEQEVQKQLSKDDE